MGVGGGAGGGKHSSKTCEKPQSMKLREPLLPEGKEVSKKKPLLIEEWKVRIYWPNADTATVEKIKRKRGTHEFK